MSSIMVSIIIDNVEEDADMQAIADAATKAVADTYKSHDVILNDWECE